MKSFAAVEPMADLIDYDLDGDDIVDQLFQTRDLQRNNRDIFL